MRVWLILLLRSDTHIRLRFRILDWNLNDFDQTPQPISRKQIRQIKRSSWRCWAKDIESFCAFSGLVFSVEKIHFDCGILSVIEYNDIMRFVQFFYLSFSVPLAHAYSDRTNEWRERESERKRSTEEIYASAYKSTTNKQLCGTQNTRNERWKWENH